MPTILDEIVDRKWQEIAAARAATADSELERRAAGMPPVRDFTGQLQRPGIRIIAEVKKASPSAGIIRADFDPVAVARTYEAHGADCLSVLTDKPFFQGDLRYLTAVREAVCVPVLRKEFILDRYQLLEARAGGASETTSPSSVPRWVRITTAWPGSSVSEPAWNRPSDRARP